MLVASAIQGLAVKTPLKAQGFGSDESLTRCRGRTGKNVMRKLSISVSFTQLQLPGKVCCARLLSAPNARYISGSLLFPV